MFAFIRHPPDTLMLDSVLYHRSHTVQEGERKRRERGGEEDGQGGEERSRREKRGRKGRVGEKMRGKR